ncbi:unnamed protein product [Rangifer tarandus platyrhynchus]|uniref:Uncharacterized protein n=1 Tax=Rangifer tarandus platyrhynchus TaxID=3082113 RepID=A0ABN8YXX1_RANTA|nr:unnamed protein product [Rangifer tarandus platyrhynchus]
MPATQQACKTAAWTEEEETEGAAVPRPPDFLGALPREAASAAGTHLSSSVTWQHASGFPRKADPRTQAEVGELRLAKGLVVTNSRAMTEPPASRRPPARRTEAAPGESRPTVCCWKDAPLLERGPRA